MTGCFNIWTTAADQIKWIQETKTWICDREDDLNQDLTLVRYLINLVLK